MRLKTFSTALLILIIPAPAWAYMGPGLGMGAVMTSLGVIGAILLGLFSILWYPAKRLVRRIARRGPRR
jgi:hypothetical protein